jgi:hypothetical protein
MRVIGMRKRWGKVLQVQQAKEKGCGLAGAIYLLRSDRLLNGNGQHFTGLTGTSTSNASLSLRQQLTARKSITISSLHIAYSKSYVVNFNLNIMSSCQ